MFADVGPATLTADPRLFQQRLRELHVQVRCPWLVRCLHPCTAVGPQSNPCFPWGLTPPRWGLRTGLGLRGADHTAVGTESVGAPGTCNEAEPSQLTALVPKWECFPWESLHKLFMEPKICSSRSAVCKLFVVFFYFFFFL